MTAVMVEERTQIGWSYHQMCQNGGCPRGRYPPQRLRDHHRFAKPFTLAGPLHVGQKDRGLFLAPVCRQIRLNDQSALRGVL